MKTNYIYNDVDLQIMPERRDLFDKSIEPKQFGTLSMYYKVKLSL
jgi:hypothetical protein